MEKMQKYIPTVYTLVWDYCLLYSKTAYQCTVYPELDPCLPLDREFSYSDRSMFSPVDDMQCFCPMRIPCFYSRLN